MKYRNNVMVFVVAVGTLLLSACPAPEDTGTATDQIVRTSGNDRGSSSSVPQYPIPRSDRPYQNIHQRAKDAWFEVEVAYFVIADKWQRATVMLHSEDNAEREQGSTLRREAGDEVTESIFTIRENVEQGFLDAIEAEPDNPLNYATYAYFLKARKRKTADGKGVVDTEGEALVMIDKAIELWPDESTFYMIKVHILIEANRCHEWWRGSAGEEYLLYNRVPGLEELFTKARKYYPDNHWFNYYHAIILARLSPPDRWGEAREKILRELREGNDKPYGFFAFPPPLQPYPNDIKKVSLQAEHVKAQYIDQWTHFGHYDAMGISMLVDGMSKDLSWPEDKEDVGEVMYFLYQVGRTLPFDRSAFGLQLKLLDAMHRKLEPGSEESKKLSEAIRYLKEQYRDVAQTLYRKGIITDPTMLDVRGINEQEKTGNRKTAIHDAVQGPQAYFLNRCEELLGLDFPLPSNPALW